MTARFIGTACLAVLLAACSRSPAPVSNADRDAILQQMHATWHRPDAPLDAGPVAIEGDYAVADWTQGDRGGRALLRREGGAWTTLLCAGDGIRDAVGLREVGVPAPQADALAARLAALEAQVAPERLRRMSTFAGVMRMQAEGRSHGAHR